ncbi:hypothetical protein IV487_10820, partial [Enterococcus saccharolyticus]|nr:hypothetical protein [Enterococcus saccharolyticus]
MNHFYTYGRHFDYLDYDRELKKMGKKQYLNKIFEEAENDINLFLAKIKSLGLEINEYSIKETKNPLLAYYNEILKKQPDININNTIQKHLSQVHQLNQLFIESNITINKLFQENISSEKYLLSQFVVFLEYQLRILIDINEHDVSIEETIVSFDSYIYSSGVILTYLLHKIGNVEQCGYTRIFSERDLLWNIDFYTNYIERDNLMDAFEYWKYSEIEITQQNSKVHIDFIDKDFNRAVLVSNFRYKNYMSDVEKDILNCAIEHNIITLDDTSVQEVNNYISNELCLRYFGKENMNKLIFGIELRKWITSIHFLQSESINYLEKQNENFVLSIQSICIARTKFEWKKRLIKFSANITSEEAEIILDKLTFNKHTKDLVDAPLIRIQEKLIILPTLTKSLRPFSAILSMFSTGEDEGEYFSFKGLVFEERMKYLLHVCAGIASKKLHVKLNKKIPFEREMDIAFILDRHLFLIECKSFNQPYTVRE